MLPDPHCGHRHTDLVRLQPERLTPEIGRFLVSLYMFNDLKIQHVSSKTDLTQLSVRLAPTLSNALRQLGSRQKGPGTCAKILSLLPSCNNTQDRKML
jgi:hypothetical protein